MISGRIPCQFLLFFITFLPPLTAQGVLESEAAAPEGQLRQGTLPNGLHYPKPNAKQGKQ